MNRDPRPTFDNPEEPCISGSPARAVQAVGVHGAGVMTYAPAEHPPFCWEHLPLRHDPNQTPDAPYWHLARVMWAPYMNYVADAVADDRLPIYELGPRPAWEAHAWAP